MKTYRGYRKIRRGLDGAPVSSECAVFVRNAGGRSRPLSPRLDLRNLSPTGFEWGYCGSGPAQLALALVADCCGRSLAVPGIYQRVKETIVARLPADGWTLTEDELLAVIWGYCEGREPGGAP